MSWVKVTCKEDGNGIYIKWESVVAISKNPDGHTDILLDCTGAEKILHAKETPEEIMHAMGYTKKEDSHADRPHQLEDKDKGLQPTAGTGESRDGQELQAPSGA